MSVPGIGPLVADGDFLPTDDEATGARAAKGGIRTRMESYFQKQKNTPAVQAVIATS